MSRLNSLLELLEKEPDDVFLLYGISLEYMSVNDHVSAEKYLKKLLEIDSNYVPAYMMLGQLKEKIGDNNEAADVYKEGIRAAKQKGDIKAANEMESFLDDIN